LAPEHPFPAAAVIDAALSAVEFMLDGTLDGNLARKNHIGGVLAGGSLALVAGSRHFVNVLVPHPGV
jgi:acetyl esterase/lipase